MYLIELLIGTYLLVIASYKSLYNFYMQKSDEFVLFKLEVAVTIYDDWLYSLKNFEFELK